MFASHWSGLGIRGGIILGVAVATYNTLDYLVSSFLLAHERDCRCVNLADVAVTLHSSRITRHVQHD